MTREIHPVPPSPNSWRLNAAIRQVSRRRGFFADPGHFIKDHSWIHYGGRWHVFYIRGREAGCFLQQTDEEVGHASTADFAAWQVHDPVGVEGAPSIIEKGGTFYLFSNRVRGSRERSGVILATSADLDRWRIHEGSPVYVPNPKLYAWPDLKHCRDYHVMALGDGYLMLFAELTRDSVGCVGAIRSRDLISWEDIGPIFLLDKPDAGLTQWKEVGFGIPESPFLMEKDGRWHLWCTDNLTTRTIRLWSDAPLTGWSWNRSAAFLGSPVGWDWASADPPDASPGAAGLTAAAEIIETDCGWLTSYYYFDPTEGKTVLKIEPLAWHDGHPFIQSLWD